MVKIVSRLILLAMLLASTPALAGRLQVVTLYSPPLAYEEQGEVVGLAAELVLEGLRRIGLEADISIMPWKRAVFMTRFGEADAIFYAVRNAEREEWFHYPDESLVREATVAIRRAAEDIVIHRGRTEYGDYRLGIGRGYYYGPDLTHFLEKARFAKVEEATTIESNFNKLLEKRIDVFLADLNLARYFLKKKASRGLVEIVKDDDGQPIVLDSVDSHLAFSRETVSPKVAEQFGKALRLMKNDGTYDRIMDKYR